MPRGGKRKNAGRKRDATPTDARRREARKIEKEVLREETRALIAPNLARLLAAQIANATGIKYLVTRDKKTGKFIRVTEAMARRKQKTAAAAATDAPAENEEVIEVWEKDPNVQAFTDLMNRLIDKPAEQFNVKADVKHRHTLEDLVVGSQAET
jgi:hypothetical protein